MMGDNSRYKKGLAIEKMGAMYLRLKGYKIIASRLRTPVGEIDILATHGTTFVIVEVKYRKKIEDALYAITPRQQERLMRAGGWIMNKYGATDIRFDAFVVGRHGIQHIKNAWGHD